MTLGKQEINKTDKHVVKIKLQALVVGRDLKTTDELLEMFLQLLLE
jgi:hypothetical protein